MNARKICIRSSTTNFNELVAKCAPRIVTFGLLLVLVTTLFPFNFSFKDGFSVKEIVSSFENSPSNLSDRLKNILLFLPLGFGLTYLLHAKRLGATTKLTAVLLVSAGLSFTVEVLQAFLPSRVPTSSDVLNNTLGGLLGFLCFHVWRLKIISYASALIEKSKNCLSIKNLTAVLIGYIALVFLISLPVQSSATNLRNWEPSFPLLLGNERTGNRPWQGYVSELYIADRAISTEEVARVFSDKHSFTDIVGDSLLASYRLSGKGSYHDRTGHLSDLSWRRKPQDDQDGTGVFLTSNHWLETKVPVTSMTQRIRQTSQFTLSTTVATADTAQSGLARIISLSSSPTERNFTLGQEGTYLVFLLRTSITEKNRIYFEEVFRDTNPHHLVITYSGSVLQLYTDKLQNFYSLDMLDLIPKSDKILYYELIFIPLGSLLALIFTLSKGKSLFHIFLLFSGVLLPSLILEGILASGSGRSIRLENLLLSILITASTILILKMRVPSWLKSNTAN